jgi:nascent polypeptide-associated complex subunit beta
METNQAILDARAKMMAKMAGGKTEMAGGVRRKKRNVHKPTGQDDKRLQNTLKRIGMNSVPGIEEVNMFTAGGEVIHFSNPKVQANIAANTYVIGGHAETKKLTDMLPGIITQLGPDNLTQLKNIASTLGQGGGKPTAGSDEDVPEMDGSFEDVE